MPYIIEERDGEYCVIKENSGEVLACHDALEDAKKHQEALSDTKARWSLAYINDLPDSAFLFVEAGEKDEEGKTTPRSLRHLPIRNANGELDAAHLRAAISRANQVKLSDGSMISREKAEELKNRARSLLEKLQSSKGIDELSTILDNIIVSDSISNKSEAILDIIKEFEPVVKSDTQGRRLLEKARAVAKQISGVAEPSFYVWKDTTSNTWRWEGIYSNTLKDRDNPPDTITADAHKGFAFLVQEGLVDYPELRLWHLPGKAVIGKADKVEYKELNNVGYAVASGTFYPGTERYVRKLAKQPDLAMSHGMPTRLIRRDDHDESLIKAYVSTEVSVLPRWGAANEETYFIVKEGEDSMKELSEEQREWLLKLGYGEEDIAEMSNKELGMKLKAQEDRDIYAEFDAFRAEVEDLIRSVGEAISSIAEQTSQTSQKLAELQQSDEDKIKAKINATPALSLAEIFSKSVVGSTEARVDKRTTLSKDAPEENDEIPDGGMIPLISKLIYKSARGENVNVKGWGGNND